jgi:hypothetical protein
MRIPPFLRKLLLFLAIVVLSWYLAGRPHSISQWWQSRTAFNVRYARPAGLVSAALLAFYLLYFSISAILYKRKGYDPMGSGCLWTMAGMAAGLGALLGLGFALRQNWLISFAAAVTIAPTISIIVGLIIEAAKALRTKWNAPS